MYHFVGNRIADFLKSGDCRGEDIISILRGYPPLCDLYARSVGGRDQLTLMQHTTYVMQNFEDVFERRVRLFFSPAYFKLLIAVHDVGKPQAMHENHNEIQHEYTLDVLRFEFADADERNKFHILEGRVLGNA